MGFKSTIDYVTTASTGNASDYGDLRVDTYSAGSSNGDTYGAYFGGSQSGLGSCDDIEYVTMSSTGNSTNWGQLSSGNTREAGGLSNVTRGIRWGSDGVLGWNIEYWPWASTGNSSDFGDLSQNTGRPTNRGVEDTIRGIGAGGQISGGSTGRMDYITFASTGNATEFGDMVVYGDGGSYSDEGNKNSSACSNGTRGEIGGGTVPFPSWPGNEATDGIQYITIASLGDATDYGSGNLLAKTQEIASGQGSA